MHTYTHRSTHTCNAYITYIHTVHGCSVVRKHLWVLSVVRFVGSFARKRANTCARERSNLNVRGVIRWSKTTPRTFNFERSWRRVFVAFYNSLRMYVYTYLYAKALRKDSS